MDDEIEAVVQQPAEALPFKEFLESVHPSREVRVSSLWMTHQGHRGLAQRLLQAPPLRLHCLDPECAGERTFRSQGARFSVGKEPTVLDVEYTCGDCRRSTKFFSLLVTADPKGNGGLVYKFGEKPAFGEPVPNKVLRLFGKDRKTFLKGRQCENQGLGIGAFAYYRRMVENHKNEIFDEIIRVCQTVPASDQLIEELRNAKNEISFSKAVEKIKAGLPQGLLINGHNPILLLHGALSEGLHSESDEACLKAAHAVRLVLTDLTEKMSMLRQENKELKDAVKLLLSKRGGPPANPEGAA